MDINTIYTIDALKGLRKLKDGSVNCIVTSPPYWMLRDYGIKGQLGMEPTPEKYVKALVKIFTEVRRVLADDGTLWLNIGDSYASSSGGYKTTDSDFVSVNTKNNVVKRGKVALLKPKDLVGIPWMVAFALRKAGWYLRQDIIWSKPNPMPESVTDRCTKSHEYIFMFSKSQKYYYDSAAIRTEAKNPLDDVRRIEQRVIEGNKSNPDAIRNGLRPRPDKQRGHSRKHAGFNSRWDEMSVEEQMSMGANKRSVWNVATKPFKDAHFATFPPELIVDCIKAGCPEGGLVLDPFMGAGTTAMVARKLDRNFIGFELNPEYVKIASTRLQKELGLFI